MLFKNCHLECCNRVEKPRELTKVELWSQIGSRHFDIMYCINLKIGTRPRFLLNTIHLMSFLNSINVALRVCIPKGAAAGLLTFCITAFLPPTLAGPPLRHRPLFIPPALVIKFSGASSNLPGWAVHLGHAWQPWTNYIISWFMVTQVTPCLPESFY